MNHPGDPACNLYNEETEEGTEARSGLLYQDDSGNSLGLNEEENDKGKKSEFSEIVEHSADKSIPSWLEKILQELQQHPLLWTTAPQWVKDLLFVRGGFSGTRIIMIDYHKLHAGGQKVWHINTDLKILKGFNHKDLTPVLLGLSQFIDSFPKFPDVLIILPYPIYEGIDYMEQYLPEPVDG